VRGFQNPGAFRYFVQRAFPGHFFSSLLTVERSPLLSFLCGLCDASRLLIPDFPIAVCFWVTGLFSTTASPSSPSSLSHHASRCPVTIFFFPVAELFLSPPRDEAGSPCSRTSSFPAPPACVLPPGTVSFFFSLYLYGFPLDNGGRDRGFFLPPGSFLLLAPLNPGYLSFPSIRASEETGLHRVGPIPARSLYLFPPLAPTFFLPAALVKPSWLPFFGAHFSFLSLVGPARFSGGPRPALREHLECPFVLHCPPKHCLFFFLLPLLQRHRCG